MDARPYVALRPGRRRRPGVADDSDPLRARTFRRPPSLRPGERDLLVDAAMLAAATGAAVASAPAADVPVEGVGWMLAFPILVLGLLGLRHLYRPAIGRRFLDDARTVVAVAAVAAMALTFVRELFTDDPHAAAHAVRAWVFGSVYLIAGRGGVRLVELRMARRPGAGRPTLIIGAGMVGHLIARRLLEDPEVGLRPAGFIDPDPRQVEEATGLLTLGEAGELERIVREHGIEHAIVSFSKSPHEADLAIASGLQELGVSVSVVPRLFEGIPDNITLERVAGLPLLSIYPSNPRGWQFSVKYSIDRLLALAAIGVLAPLLLVVSLAILLTSGRPLFFAQRRVGLDRREFMMLKFRTMTGDPAEQGEADAVWAAKIAEPGEPSAAVSPPDDPGTGGGQRNTGLGALLRRLGLDELPQLFNVLRGEMSIVGPRPEREAYVRMFERRVHRYPERHRVKAGITGWAQVHGLRGETSLEDRVEWDNYYIENWSLWLDLKILLLTLPVELGAVFRRPWTKR